MASLLFSLFRPSPVSPTTPITTTSSTKTAAGGQQRCCDSKQQQGACADYAGIFCCTSATWRSGVQNVEGAGATPLLPSEDNRQWEQELLLPPAATQPDTHRHRDGDEVFKETRVAVADLNAQRARRLGAASSAFQTVAGDGAAAAAASSRRVRVCQISDTHEMHHHVELPEADLLVFAGDLLLNDRFSPRWLSERNLDHVLNFLDEQRERGKFRHCVLCCGNHEDLIQKYYATPAETRERFGHARDWLHFLAADEVLLVAGVTVFGNSYSSATGSGNTAFQGDQMRQQLSDDNPALRTLRDVDAPRRQQQEQEAASPPPPPPLDLLVTHCHKIAQEVSALNPLISCAGHWHGMHGLHQLRRQLPRDPQRARERFGGAAASDDASRLRVEPGVVSLIDFVPLANGAICDDISARVFTPVLYPPLVFDLIPRRQQP